MGQGAASTYRNVGGGAALVLVETVPVRIEADEPSADPGAVAQGGVAGAELVALHPGRADRMPGVAAGLPVHFRTAVGMEGARAIGAVARSKRSAEFTSKK